MTITLPEIEVVECMPKGAVQGHIHAFCQVHTTLNKDGKGVGEISVAPNLTIVLRVGGDLFHVDVAEMIWKAVEKELSNATR